MENPVSILLILAGISLLIVFFRVLYFYKVTLKDWGKAKGTIIDNKVGFHNSLTDPDYFGWKNSITYQFKIGGKFYQSNSFSKNITVLMPFRKMVESNQAYHQGKEIVVFYNPKNPHESIIENNFSYYNFIYLLLAVLSFTIAYCFFE